MEKIKELRKKNDMTQQQLSEMLGVTRTTVANWELGICSPNLTYKLYEHDYENCIVQYVVVAESKPLTAQSSDNLIRTLKKYGMRAEKKEVLI